MAFNLPNFVGQTYQPDYSGIGDAVSNYFQGKMMPSQALIEKVKAQFAQPQAQADLDAARLKNIYQGIQNQFEGQTEQADIDLKKAQAGYYQQGGGRGGVDLQTLAQAQNEVATLNPNLTSPQDLSDAATAYSNGLTNLPDGRPLAKPSWRLNQLLGFSYKQSTDAAQRDQQRFASTLDTLFDKADKKSSDAFSFAGGVGRGKEAEQAALAQVGKESPEYDNYVTFKNVDVPSLVSEIVRTSGAKSTDSQKAMALGSVISTNLGTNPKIAEQSWNELKDMYRTIGKTISQTPVQQRQTFTSGGSGNSAQPQFTEGKIYVDAKGNRARMVNGQWEEV